MREEYFASFAKAARRAPEYFVVSPRDGSPGKETAAEGHYAAGAAHLANVAFRKGRRVHWDLKTNKVSDS